MNEGTDPIDILKRYCAAANGERSASKTGDASFYQPMGEKMFGCFFDILLKLIFNPSACGSLVVSAGSQEIKVTTYFKPSEVYLSLSEPEGKPGCGPRTDSFDIKYVEDGFILVTNTNSPQRKVKWKAIG
jgi:hypothetical protein